MVSTENTHQSPLVSLEDVAGESCDGCRGGGTRGVGCESKGNGSGEYRQAAACHADWWRLLVSFGELLILEFQ